jgi:hypothetical protein
MQLNNYFKDKMPIVAALGVLFGLSSCGSYQYAGYEDDIYGSSERRVEYQEQRTDKEVEQNNNTYYKNYFSEKSQELDAMAAENEIFTDIDSYEGSYAEDDSMEFNPSGYAGWGQENSQVTINVNAGFGYNNWWWGQPFYGYGWGWNRWNRWNRWNYGWGWNNWGYGGFYDPFWCPPYYGYGGYGYGYAYSPYWNRGYYGGYYGNRYNGRSLAYNSGRRGSMLNRNLTTNRNTYSLGRRSSTNNSNSSYNLSRRRSSTNSNSTGVNRPRRSNNNIGTRVNSPRRNNSSNNTRNYTPRRRITTLLDGIILQDVHQIITGLQHHQEVRVIQDHQVEVVRHLQEEQAADEIINPII